jgi:hypothetical protein
VSGIGDPSGKRFADFNCSIKAQPEGFVREWLDGPAALLGSNVTPFASVAVLYQSSIG